jgi:hypothetical protein
VILSFRVEGAICCSLNIGEDGAEKLLITSSAGEGYTLVAGALPFAAFESIDPD